MTRYGHGDRRRHVILGGPHVDGPHLGGQDMDEPHLDGANLGGPDLGGLQLGVSVRQRQRHRPGDRTVVRPPAPAHSPISL